MAVAWGDEKKNQRAEAASEGGLCNSQNISKTRRREIWWSRRDSNPRPSRLSPGRAHQPFDHFAVLPGLQLSLSFHSIGSRRVLFLVNQFPWAAILQGFGIACVVIHEPIGNGFSLANVVTARGFALEDG